MRSHLTLYCPKSLRRLYASWSFYDSDPPVQADIMPPGGYICMRRDACSRPHWLLSRPQFAQLFVSFGAEVRRWNVA